jgi:hypothetical protein
MLPSAGDVLATGTRSGGILTAFWDCKRGGVRRQIPATRGHMLPSIPEPPVLPGVAYITEPGGNAAGDELARMDA